MKLTKEFIIESSTKALVSFIPHIGGAIGSLLSDVLAERKQQRINEFLTNLQVDLETHQKDINKDFVRKDDFLDIFELAAKKIMDERNENKRLAYKNIILNGILLSASNYDDVEQCIRIVENVTETNIFLLKILHDPEGYDHTVGNPTSQLNNRLSVTIERILKALLPTWPTESIVENLKDLEFAGLIYQISSNLRDMSSGRDFSPIRNKVTEKGNRLVRYIVK